MIVRNIKRNLSRLLASAAFFTSGCVLFERPPGPTTYEARLAAFPTDGLALEQAVTIRWDRHQIPFVEAATDGDAAYALGLVHAHLRLGQMAVLRRIAQGRLAESGGPLAADIDAALRTFDFGRASGAIYAAMPPASRTWLDRFVEGVNHSASTIAPIDLPHEFKLLNIDWEPWSAEDSITLGRVSGVDINWGTLISLLKLEDTGLRDRVLARVLRATGAGATTMQSVPGIAAAELRGLEALAMLGPLVGKSGSNSFAIAAHRSASGAAMIANDPHLGFVLPNLWLVAGLRSPSYTFAGMMAVGTPVFGFGRNPNLAWGGTNLRATTSQLVDISDLPADQITVSEQPLKQRFWFDTSTKVRFSPYGPIMSNLAALPNTKAEFAVRWVGHTVSDEVTALLGAMQANTFSQFRQAMATFALPSQTFLVADTEGTIASMIATKVPARTPDDPVRLTVDPASSDAHWQGFYWGTDLPYEVNPAAGFLASSNNRPSADESKPYGGFFPQDERVRRLRERLAEKPVMSLDDFKAIQRDTVSPLTREVLAALRPALEVWPVRGKAERQAIALLLAWDADYAADSQAAPVFEALLTQLAPAVYAQLDREAEFEVIKSMSFIRNFLIEDLADLTPAQWQAALGISLEGAASMAASGKLWGDIHRLRVRHVLGNVPVIGSRYEIEEFAVGGSRETVFKTSHPLTDEKHNASFGAQSRHVSDMGDVDENYFVLFGGQDGRIGSPNFTDQVSLWRDGGYVRIPLRPESVAKAFPTAMVLKSK